MSIKGMLAASVAVASAAVVGSAQAADLSYNLYNPTTQTGTFGNNGSIGNTTFTNTFTFVVTRAGTLASSFTNASSADGGNTDIDFSSVNLSGGSLTSTLSYGKLLGEPVSDVEVWGSPKGTFLGVGTYMLNIMGRSYGNLATYGGNFNVTAVPEIATWAMMILGVGAIGAVQRRRVATKVRFA